MTITFMAIPTNQPIGTFYTAVVGAADLLTMCEFDYRKLRDDRGDPDFFGIQRPYNLKRIAEIAEYSKHVDACFPTCIVLSLDERCVETADGPAGTLILNIHDYFDPDDPDESVPIGKAASIIDGQHRLKGLERGDRERFQMPVTLFLGAEPEIRANLFSTVNLSQSKVNRSLAYDLFSLAKERSPQKTCHEIVVSLDSLPDSPFHERIKRLGTATPGREGETLSQASVIRGIIRYISREPASDRDLSMRGVPATAATGRDIDKLVLREFYRRGDDDAILDLLLNYFDAIRGRWEVAWLNDGRGNMINRTNGYDGFMKFFPNVYRHITTTSRVVSEDEFAALFKKVDLKDSDFSTSRFPPGSSGASELYRELTRQTGIVA